MVKNTSGRSRKFRTPQKVSSSPTYVCSKDKALVKYPRLSSFKYDVFEVNKISPDIAHGKYRFTTYSSRCRSENFAKIRTSALLTRNASNQLESLHINEMNRALGHLCAHIG